MLDQTPLYEVTLFGAIHKVKCGEIYIREITL
jgi:hypothetical protein